MWKLMIIVLPCQNILQENKFGGSFSHSWHFTQYFAECFGGFGSLPKGKKNESRRELMHRRFERQIAPCKRQIAPCKRQIAPCKGIRIPGSEKFLLLETQIRKICACGTEILCVRLRNSAHDTRNSANHWNPESKFQWQGIQNPVPRIRNPWLGVQNLVLNFLTWGETDVNRKLSFSLLIYLDTTTFVFSSVVFLTEMNCLKNWTNYIAPKCKKTLLSIALRSSKTPLLNLPCHNLLF